MVYWLVTDLMSVNAGIKNPDLLFQFYRLVLQSSCSFGSYGV